MAPKSQRSRACPQCRERRVKCDETAGFCNQCRRLGLACSGPVVGSVIIDMTDRVVKPRARKKKTMTPSSITDTKTHAQPSPFRRDSIHIKSELQETETQLNNVPARHPPSPEATQWSTDAERAITAIRYQYKVPSLYQPINIQSDALDMAFLSHFVEMNRGVQSYSQEIPWLTHLPVLHTKATKSAVKFSIRAASMAFFAQIHHDPSILVESYRWYNVSLGAQRLSLSRLTGQNIPDDEEILVPIILGLYEVYAGTTNISVIHHLSAAAEMIKMRGPRNCSSGVVWPLFKGMRVSDSHKSLIFNVPSVFSSHDWMTLPFYNMPRNAHQDLADIILKTPHCISLCQTKGSLRTFFANPIPSHVDPEPCRTRTLELLAELHAWADKFPHLTSLSPSPHKITADMASLSVNGVKSTHPDAKTAVLPDSFVALTAATYEVMKITFTLLLYKLDAHSSSLSPSPSPLTPTPTPFPPPQLPSSSSSSSSSSSPSSPSPSYPPPIPSLNEITQSSKSVLEIAAFLESTRPIGFDFMRSVFPLVVVALLGPGEAEKEKAKAVLQRWGERRGIGGLCGAWLHI